jgi:hypothetical protein
LYCENYFRVEGIKIDPTQVRDNPGLRDISKRKLNALYGRFGLNTHKTNNKILDNPEDFNNLFLDDVIDVLNYHLINPEKILVQYKVKDQYKPVNKKGNVIIASFVAMYGRLELYKQLRVLKERVLYMDTDSILYVSIHGEYEPDEGDMLGCWMDEIKNKYGREVYIVEYCGLAPKVYGMKLSNNVTIVKVKGATLNILNSQTITFETLKNFATFIHDNNVESEEAIYVEQILNFVRNKITGQIVNKPNRKILSLTYDKRQMHFGDYCTYPYGFIRQ